MKERGTEVRISASGRRLTRVMMRVMNPIAESALGRDDDGGGGEWRRARFAKFDFDRARRSTGSIRHKATRTVSPVTSTG